MINSTNAEISHIHENALQGVNSIKVNQNPAIRSNRLLLISDCKNADLFIANNYWGTNIDFNNKLKITNESVFKRIRVSSSILKKKKELSENAIFWELR